MKIEKPEDIKIGQWAQEDYYYGSIFRIQTVEDIEHTKEIITDDAPGGEVFDTKLELLAAFLARVRDKKDWDEIFLLLKEHIKEIEAEVKIIDQPT